MENRLVPPAASRWTPSPSPACAARACWVSLTGGLRLLRVLAGVPASCAAVRPTRSRHGRLCHLPGGLMASLSAKPLLCTRERRRGAAAVNRWLAGGRPSPSASTATACWGNRAVVTGNPVRAARSPPARAGSALSAAGAAALLVVGGSLGARAQRHPAAALALLPGRAPGGHAPDRRLTRTRRGAAAYANAGVRPNCCPFIDDTAGAREADLIVCRAGASTVTSCARRRRARVLAARRQHDQPPARQRRRPPARGDAPAAGRATPQRLAGCAG